MIAVWLARRIGHPSVARASCPKHNTRSLHCSGKAPPVRCAAGAASSSGLPNPQLLPSSHVYPVRSLTGLLAREAHLRRHLIRVRLRQALDDVNLTITACAHQRTGETTRSV